jgi:hypothetical protein
VKLSAQERERRRQVALRLHREGRLGSRAHQSAGGKAKARKASELAQRLVQDNEAAIEKTLREILKSGTKAQKLRAIESVLKLGISAGRLDVAEHREELHHRDRQELLDVLADKLTSGPTGQASKTGFDFGGPWIAATSSS